MNLNIEVATEPVQLRASGTLWLPRHDTLVVADLHLEKGSAYASRGQLLPPYDTRETIDRLILEVNATQARQLILLGDSLHDMGAISRIPAPERQALHELAEALELVWITGNHDPDGGSVFGGQTASELKLGHLTFVHEPTMGPKAGEVAGHLHPCAKLSGVGGRIRSRCFVSDGSRLIMPAFGAYTGGLNILDKAYQGLFAKSACAYLTGRKVSKIGFDKLSPDRSARPPLKAAHQ